MLKRLVALFSATICLALIWTANKTPLFKEYADYFELYLDDGSSNARIVRVSERDYAYIDGICGESFKTDVDGFDLDGFLSVWKAEVVTTEKVDGVTLYYAYSPKIDYRAQISGKTVNLHIAVSNQITVGSPIIFGSF